MIRRICLILIDDWVETSGTGVEFNVGTADADEGSLSCEPSLDKDYLTSLRELKVQSNIQSEERQVDIFVISQPN